MEAEKIIKEKEIVHEDEHKDYASKGVGNAGLTLGIIGTALGAWAVSRNRGGLFGGGWGAGMPGNVHNRHNTVCRRTLTSTRPQEAVVVPG